jgi:ABC-type dipeptide/oligopeptide/nickel transport system ATPase component
VQGQGLSVNPTALEKNVSDVQQCLETSPVVGIVGPGGSGKSTIVERVFRSIFNNYEYTCFVDDVKRIQTQNLDDIIRGLFRLNGSTPEGNVTEWRQLEGKRTLIVLDGVDSTDQLEVLPKLGDDTRLIITTRNEGLLSYFANCQIYKVVRLNFEEAKTLFCKYAFAQASVPDHLLESHHNMEKNVRMVVEECKGLPIDIRNNGLPSQGLRT